MLTLFIISGPRSVRMMSGTVLDRKSAVAKAWLKLAVVSVLSGTKMGTFNFVQWYASTYCSPPPALVNGP